MGHPVTIIVPVYGDWPSLSECIESLKEHVDRRHTVLLVNDIGPEAEIIRANIQRAIKDVKNFSYHENKENLGFLQNCNHAVFDLDATSNDILLLNSDTRVTKGFLEEMLAVLYINEKHGAVSPRSNNATIFTLPFQRAYPVKDDLAEDMAYSWGTFQAVKSKLARYTEVPVGHGFCLLIRRSLIAEYGLFDEIYGKGYGEESDFCMRIRQHGYKSVMANHAFVFHFESRSFTSERRNKLVAEHAKIVASRYPEHDGLIAQYIEAMPREDWFADVIANRERKRVLINLLSVTDEETELANATHLVREFIDKTANTNTDYVIACQPPMQERLSGWFVNTIFVSATQISGIFHLGYTPKGLSDPNQVAMLQKACYQIAAFQHGPVEPALKQLSPYIFASYTADSLAKITRLLRI